MTANAAELRDGLLFILGGGWIRYSIPQIPFETVWFVVLGMRWRDISRHQPRGVYLSVINPAGHESSCQAVTITEDSVNAGSGQAVVPIGVALNAKGVWTLRVHSGGFLLAEIGIQVEIAH